MMKKSLVILGVTFLFGQMSFAQKEYIDPSKKVKRPLLDGIQTPQDNSSGTVEAKPLPAVSDKKEKVEQQYCACVNSQRLTEEAAKIHEKMYYDNIVDSEEFYEKNLKRQSDDKRKLVNHFVNREDLDTSKIDCDVVRLETKRFKVYLSEIKKLDEACNFEEIKRKKY